MLHAQQRQPQQLNGSFSESFGGLASLLAPSRYSPRSVGAAMWPKPLWIMLAATNTLGKPFVSLVRRPLLRQRSTVRQRRAHAGVVHQSTSCLEIYSVGLHLRSTRGLFTSAAPARHQRRLPVRRRTRPATTHRRGPPPGPRRWPPAPRELLGGRAPRYQEARHNAAPTRRSGRTFENIIVVVSSSA